MSADTTVVIAACLRSPEDRELSYTAEVCQAVENFYDEEYALRVARSIFLSNPHRVWFAGVGGLSRAKQLANLLAQELRENGILEYEDRPIIEIGADRVYILSRKGKRKPQDCYGADGTAPLGGINAWEDIPDRAFHL